MDKKAIRKALDSFENDQFVDAKDIIKKEVAGKRDIFLKDKLGLANNISTTPEQKEDDNKNGTDGE